MILILNNFLQQILLWAGSKKAMIVSVIDAFSILLILFLTGTYAASTRSLSFLPTLGVLGLDLGKAAIFFFLATTVPGILGRFGLKSPLITLGMMFRRHTGRLSFLFAFTHASFVYLIPVFATSTSLFPLPTFLLMGLTALSLLLILYLTSNDLFIRVMGKWWKVTHRLVYLIYWLVFLHVVMQGISLTSIIILVAAVLEIISLMFFYSKKLQL